VVDINGHVPIPGCFSGGKQGTSGKFERAAAGIRERLKELVGFRRDIPVCPYLERDVFDYGF